MTRCGSLAMIGIELCVFAPLTTQLFEPMSVSTIRLPSSDRVSASREPSPPGAWSSRAARASPRYAGTMSPGSKRMVSRKAV
jgi:hypothetical protein